jgi:hypothetical protein
VQNKGATDGWLSGKVRKIREDKKQQLAEQKEELEVRGSSYTL